MRAHDSYQEQERSRGKGAPGSERQAQGAQQHVMSKGEKSSIIDLTGVESEDDA